MLFPCTTGIDGPDHCTLHPTVKVYTCSFMLIPAKGECNTSVLPKDKSPVTVVYYLISPFAPFNFYYSSFVGYIGNSFYPSHFASLYIIQILSDYHHSSSPPFILQWEDNVVYTMMSMCFTVLCVLPPVSMVIPK